jgi:hypothetical protein
MSIDVEGVATDADLAGELGSDEALLNLVTDPDADPSTTLIARQRALGEVLDGLRNRTPPVYEADLSDVTELSRVVVYGAIARLYRNNITTGTEEDVSAAKHKIYQRLFESSVNALRPTVQGSYVSGGRSIAFSRR